MSENNLLFDIAKHAFPPLFAYDVIKKHQERKKDKDGKTSVLLQQEAGVGAMAIALIPLIILIIVCIVMYNNRAKRILRSGGRKFWAIMMIIFQTPIYLVYAALGLYIPDMDSTLPLPKGN